MQYCLISGVLWRWDAVRQQATNNDEWFSLVQEARNNNESGQPKDQIKVDSLLETLEDKINHRQKFLWTANERK